MSNLDPSIGMIAYTSTTCILKGQPSPKIPTLIWPEGIDEDASDWLRTLVLEYGVKSSSAKEYAKILRPFLRFCRQQKRTWQSVDDSFLVVWRNHLRNNLEVSVNRVNICLQTVFAFYRWAEENKRIRFHVGIYTFSDLPRTLETLEFPISAKQTFSKSSNGRVFGSWTTPLTLSNARQSGFNRHTPSEEEIRKIHSAAIEKKHGVRDTLMFSWAEETGLRRAEILCLLKSQMPTSSRLAHIIEKDEPWIISVQRKGGVVKPIVTQPELLIATLEYINLERRTVVENCRQSIIGYSEPDVIFLSGVTGMLLHPDSVTSIGSRAFKEAGVSNANIHRFRARYAVRIVESLVDAIFDKETVIPESNWTETILIKAAEMMGHISHQSLRPYLTYVLNRRIQTADASKAERLASRLRQLERKEKTIIQRLSWYPEIQEVARLIETGDQFNAAIRLDELAKNLT